MPMKKLFPVHPGEVLEKEFWLGLQAQYDHDGNVR